MKSTLFQSAVCAGLLAASTSWALPTLQLDVVGYTDATYTVTGSPITGPGSGAPVYDPIDETTVAQSPFFAVRALLKGDIDLTATYYISAAIAPKVGPGDLPLDPAFGPVTIGGTSYGIADFTYGTPPLDGLYPDVSGHSIFPTYYKEFAFTFSGVTVPAYNVQDGASSPGSLYYYDLTVDALNLLSFGPGFSNLTDLYDLHFDLYDTDTKVGKKSTQYITDNAPYSHDASSWYATVPDGGTTVLMLGLGLLGLAGIRRKFGKS